MSLNFIASLAANPLVRAYVLAGARNLGSFLGGILAAWLIKHGVAGADAASVAQSIGGLVIAGASIGLSLIDVHKVDGKVKGARSDGAASAATAIASGAATPDQVQTAASEGPSALAAVLSPAPPGHAAESALAAGKF